jgi:hypothetical protein
MMFLLRFLPLTIWLLTIYMTGMIHDIKKEYYREVFPDIEIIDEPVIILSRNIICHTRLKKRATSSRLRTN